MILVHFKSGARISISGATRAEVKDGVLYCLDAASRVIAVMEFNNVQFYSSDPLDQQLDGNPTRHTSN